MKILQSTFLIQGGSTFFFWLRWVLVAVCGLSCPEACGTRASSTGASSIEAVSLALDGRFLTTGPAGKSLRALLLLCNYSPWIYHYLKGARGIFPSFQPAAHRRFSSCRLNAGPQQVPMNTTPSTIRCAPGRAVGSTWKQEDRASLCSWGSPIWSPSPSLVHRGSHPDTSPFTPPQKEGHLSRASESGNPTERGREHKRSQWGQGQGTVLWARVSGTVRVRKQATGEEPRERLRWGASGNQRGVHSNIIKQFSIFCLIKFHESTQMFAPIFYPQRRRW